MQVVIGSALSNLGVVAKIFQRQTIYMTIYTRQELSSISLLLL